MSRAKPLPLALPQLAAIALATALAACSSPDPALYNLAAAPGAVRVGGPRIVLLHQVSLARYLERSQIVRSSENYRLQVMENDWWGEPLGAMLGRVLAEELGQRLPQTTILSETGAVSARANATIEVNIERLDEDSAGSLILQAQAAVRYTGQTQPNLRSFRFSVPPTAASVAGEVAAISVAVGKLADGIAPMLTAGGAAG
ncbi:MAG: PqiC family protein [Stellaceae bacterium]